VELQLSVSKQLFLAQQHLFIEAMARTAGVNARDVKVMSITEVNVADVAVARRQSTVLKVVTRVRTQQPAVVQNLLTLRTVNKALVQAGLP